MKEAYREMKCSAGVYVIRNRSSNKVYIDYSMNPAAIWNRHRAELKFGNHRNPALQNDWNRLGEENFVFEILGEIDDDLNQQEKEKDLLVLKELLVEQLNHSTQSIYNEK
ncbi:MAG: GIY-YIG nuclease family protein [Saprospiraceae bacterium]|nr:GIY-YIG nuclease family protein [Saprospiraceae bacterium]